MINTVVLNRHVYCKDVFVVLLSIFHTLNVERTAHEVKSNNNKYKVTLGTLYLL